MKAPMTKEKYSGRLAKFFDFNSLTEGTMEEAAKTFLRLHMGNGKIIKTAVGKPTIEKPSKTLYALMVKDTCDDSQSTYSIWVLFYLFHGEYARK
jgi:hypothetical protein